MKLYIKQKAFSFGDKFFVKDEYECDKYYVEGEVFTLGKKLHVYDSDNSEVMYISQRPFAFMPKVDIYINDTLIGTLIKEFTFFSQIYTLEGPSWDIEGDFMAHDYNMTKDGSIIATVEKEWFTWGDSYSLEVNDPSDELTALGVLLAIDVVNAAQAAAAN